MRIREKALSSDWDDWNHPKLATACLVVVTVFAAGLSFYVPPLIPGPFAVGMLITATLIVAIILITASILAVVD